MAGNIRVQVDGLDGLVSALSGISRRLPDAMGQALYPELVGVMVESQKIVPFDQGDLHDSGETDRPEINGGVVSVSLHYGSATVDYALVQHEDPEPPAAPYHHTPPGQRKFLETPLHQWTDAGPQRTVERAIRSLR